jgi:hypothetical protein
MTRFALLPLAFFANACADTEALNADLDNDLRVDVEDFGDDEARTDERQRMVEVVVGTFEAEQGNENCKAMGMVHITADSDSRQSEGFIIDRDGYVVGLVQGTAIKTNDGFTEIRMKAIEEDGLVITQAQLEIDSFDTVALGDWTSRGATRDDVETYEIGGRVKTMGSVQEIRAAVAECR